MMTLIAAAAVAAAQPANAPPNAPASHAPLLQMGASSEKHGQMADMKGCCCKDMMSKTHEGHRAGHDSHSAH